MSPEEYLNSPMTDNDRGRLTGEWESFLLVKIPSGRVTAIGYRREEYAHDLAQSLMRIFNELNR